MRVWSEHIDTGNCGGLHCKQIIVITFSLETEQWQNYSDKYPADLLIYSGYFKISHILDDILIMFKFMLIFAQMRLFRARFYISPKSLVVHLAQSLHFKCYL